MKVAIKNEHIKIPFLLNGMMKEAISSLQNPYVKWKRSFPSWLRKFPLRKFYLRTAFHFTEKVLSGFLSFLQNQCTIFYRNQARNTPLKDVSFKLFSDIISKTTNPWKFYYSEVFIHFLFVQGHSIKLCGIHFASVIWGKYLFSTSRIRERTLLFLCLWSPYLDKVIMLSVFLTYQEVSVSQTWHLPCIPRGVLVLSNYLALGRANKADTLSVVLVPPIH